MSDEFTFASYQSCLNRFLNEVNWDEKQLNELRIDWLKDQGGLHVHPRGVLALNNVLIDHEGKLIDDVGTFRDHAEQRYKIAHNYLFINYVNQHGQHDLLEFFRFKKRDQCEIGQEKFVNHTQLFIDLVNWSHTKKLWGTFTFDSYFNNTDRGSKQELSMSDCQSRNRNGQTRHMYWVMPAI
jgi:hypothetical protein